eukprot:gnl/MRDRNA2_/MRDRNA2_59200_c0_seq1.p1 gnl/MRDRNA2_/MRDRNA2_59200_c0~~gnl/MRDRNA2_/MRDRNA2_59200_c0_seq1.p1  ORF type:complete len:401 (+),score=79.93 gnl/MRDRNA2_/MRDRNA2_59200_c0_seq1:92-1204(+)
MAAVAMLPSLQRKLGERPHERPQRKTHLQVGRMIAMTPRIGPSDDGTAKQPMPVGQGKPSSINRDASLNRPDGRQASARGFEERGTSLGRPSNRSMSVGRSEAATMGLEQRYDGNKSSGRSGNRGPSVSRSDRGSSLGRSGLEEQQRNVNEKASASQTRRPPRVQRKSDATTCFSTETDTATIEAFLNNNCSDAPFLVSEGPAAPRAPPAQNSPKRQKPQGLPTMDDDSGSEEEDFAALRRKAKTGPTAPVSRDKIKVVIPDRNSSNFAPSSDIFSCEPGEKALRAAKEAAKRQSLSSDNADLDDLMLFFQMQGLKGPLRVYAKGFVAQGITDATTLMVVPEDGMKKIIQRAGLDPDDELLLTEALVNLR